MPRLPFLPSFQSYVFSRDDIDCLFRIAPLFDVLPVTLSDGSVLIQVSDGLLVRSAQVSSQVAPLRILAEVCEKLVRWVHFHEGEHCARSLFDLTDARILRLAELYKEKGGFFPEDGGKPSCSQSKSQPLKKAGAYAPGD
jgi:hypothetical protein